MPELGAPFDRYVLESVLGEGGMGRVYRAFDPRLGRRVALKVLLTGPDRFDHPAAAGRMMREARAAAAFNHPNVVAIYDVGEHDGSPFIAMELVTGKTVRQLVGAGVPTRQMLGFLLDVARGLGAAHRAGLVHRDVKPDNVMITTEGGVKVLDFGVAKLAQQLPDALAPTVTPDLPSLTGAGVAIGTPQYMPPEQLKGEPLDGRADQFAWGVMAYEALSGRHPWSFSSGAQLVAAVLSAPVRPLDEVCPDLDPRVSRAVSRALEKDREARFATMEALIAAVLGEAEVSPKAVSLAIPSEPAREGGGTTGAPVDGATFRDAKRPPSRRRGALVAIGGGTLLCALVALGARSKLVERGVGSAPMASAPDSAPPAPRTGRPPANAAAEAAYAAALQEMRDARLAELVPTLGKVIDADPSFAPAYEHRAGISLVYDDFRGARADVHAALDLRAGLGEVDAAILDAMEPAVREPPAIGEYRERITRVSDRYPGELFPAILAACAFTDAEQIDRAGALYERASAAAPDAALPFFGKGELAVRAGDLESGGRFFDQCTQASPTNVECLSGRMLVYADTGRCEEAAGVARRGLANFTGSKFYDALAATAAATGQEREVVAEYLQRANEATRPAIRGSEEAQRAYQLAFLRGDFRAAMDATLTWDAALKVEHRESCQAMLARFAVAEEARELPAHRAEIQATWSRSLAWLEPADEARLRLSYREYQVGLIDEGELQKRRDQWRRAKIEEGATSGTPASDEALWRAMYLVDAGTPEEAIAALGFYAEAGTPQLGLENSAPRDQLTFGVAYARAGNEAAALPLLREGTRMCRRLRDRFQQTQATLYLGDALAHSGDVDGARRAYQEVIAAWGSAKPASVTATQARARLLAMGN